MRHSRSQFAPMVDAWQALSGLAVQGYEIHQGQTAPHPAMVAAGDVPVPALHDAEGKVLGWRNQRGNVLGHYLHGMFEQAEVMQALFGADAPDPDQVFEGLADFIARHFEPGVLDRLIA